MGFNWISEWYLKMKSCVRWFREAFKLAGLFYGRIYMDFTEIHTKTLFFNPALTWLKFWLDDHIFSSEWNRILSVKAWKQPETWNLKKSGRKNMRKTFRLDLKTFSHEAAWMRCFQCIFKLVFHWSTVNFHLNATQARPLSKILHENLRFVWTFSIFHHFS